jgi:16S rRNA (cytidine1402-2'-O)-methyltransferase
MASLFLVATPIGNLEDISFRALRILGEAGALACEDTRLTRRIFQRYDIPPPKTIFSCHEHNEEKVVNRVLGLLREDISVALCSDGGYPGISDPGYRLVNAVLEAGHPVEVIPGPSAVPMALLASGLPSSSYTFKGFPPRKTGARKRFLAAEAGKPHTLILFESPFRIARLLEDALEALGDRRAAVCAEMTKKFEKISRGYLSNLLAEFSDRKVKGELTVVIAGNHPAFCRDTEKPE